MLRRNTNSMDTRRVSEGFKGVMINPIKRNLRYRLAG